MSQTRLLGLSVGVGVVVGMAISFVAFRPHYMQRPPPWAAQLDLTKEQKESIHKIFESARLLDHDLFKQMIEASKDMKKQFQDPKVSDEQLQQGFDRVNQLRAAAAKRRFAVDLQVRKILGPDKMKNFDPMGPPGPPMMPPPGGFHGGPGGHPPDGFPPPPPGGPDDMSGGPPPPPPFDDHD